MKRTASLLPFSFLFFSMISACGPPRVPVEFLYGSLIGHTGSVTSIAFDPQGKYLASGGVDATVRLWDLSNASEVPIILEGHTDTVRSVVFSPDGKLLATGGEDNTIRLWNISNLSESPIAIQVPFRVLSLVFSPNGEILASEIIGGRGGRGAIYIWEVSDPSIESIIETASYVYDMEFSPDGRFLVSCGEGEILVWDFHDLEDRPRSLVNNDRQILSCDFSPDGDILASSAGLVEGKGGVIHLWDFSSFQVAPILLRGHTNSIETVVFSPEGRYLASSGLFRDETIRIWDISEPDAYSFTISGTHPSVLSFSHDGKLLASTGDGIIYLWDMSKVHGEFNP